jgi:hypothetical protein
MWLHKYRLLVVIYSICLVVGVREYLVNRGSDPFGWLSPEGQELIDIIAGVNPEDPETEFLRSMQALAAGEPDEFERQIEAALAADIKHNEMMLRFHAQYLVDRGADWGRINEALNRWHRNYPFSTETITLALASGPASPAEQAMWERSLGLIPWLADFRLASQERGAVASWQVEMLFRRGRPIDIEDVVEAVSRRYTR